MESSENNITNSFVIGLAVVIAALVGLCVYRTESAWKKFNRTEESIILLQRRIDSLEKEVRKIPTAPIIKPVANKPAKKSATKTTIAKQSGATTNETKNGPVSISMNAKVINRYVEGTIKHPNITNGPGGIVVIKIQVNWAGQVVSASTDSRSTIKQENILDACKEAALKTRFSHNYDAEYKTAGTITYMFNKVS